STAVGAADAWRRRGSADCAARSIARWAGRRRWSSWRTAMRSCRGKSCWPPWGPGSVKACSRTWRGKPLALIPLDPYLQLSAPKTLNEGLARLEKVLGRQSEKDFRQWRFVIDDETRLTPDPGKSVVIVAKGVMTYGVPVPSGGIITFDQILSTRRSI